VENGEKDDDFHAIGRVPNLSFSAETLGFSCKKLHREALVWETGWGEQGL
jgi:hypothetical protein